MTMPTLIVEIGFTALSTGTALHLDDPMRGKLDTATLASGDLFTDVSQWVVSAPNRRGATRSDGPLLRYEAGTATITLRNDDRRFDPTNLAGPYVAGGVTQVEPLRAVRIRASYGGQTWPLWRGFTNQWTVVYDGPDSSYATVTCFDAFGIFAANDRNALASPVGSGETTGARINRILDSIGWPAEDRMIATGEETVQSTTLAANVLTELLLTADTELGEFFVDVDGRARFRARSSSYTSARSAYAQALFGDQPVEGVATTVNLATNPAVEVSTTGWRATGTVAPTIARDSTRAQSGTWSLLTTWGTGGSLPGVAYDITGLTVGRTYTISMYVYVPSGSPVVALISSSVWGDATTVTDQWVRLSWTGLAVATTRAIGLWPFGSPTAGQQVWIDGLQVEEGEVATAYVDGDQSGGEWDGVAHASTSRRLPELDYGDLTLAYDALSITNQVSAANVGGTEQTATDSGSVSAYLTRSHQRTDLLMQTDAEAMLWAEQVLARRAWPELRVSALLLKPPKDPDRLWAQAYGREIGDRVRVMRRPPGGGDPIVREAWVRGIEHDLSKDLNWRTTLVLEQAQDVTRLVDTFTRTVSGGWGTSDSGHAWTVDGTAAQFSVVTDIGVHRVNALSAVFRSRTTGLGLAGVDWLISVRLDLAPTGLYIRTEPAVRIVDVNNYYGLRVHVQTSGAIDLQMIRVIGGSETVLASASSGVTNVAGTALWMRTQAVGTTLRGRVWRDGTTEPTTWQITATDSTHAAGDVGVTTLFPPGNTNTLPYNVIYDNASATTLHAWT